MSAHNACLIRFQVFSLMLPTVLVCFVLFLYLTFLRMLSMEIPTCHSIPSRHVTIGFHHICAIPTISQRSVRNQQEKLSELLLCSPKHGLNPDLLFPQYATTVNSGIILNAPPTVFVQWNYKSGWNDSSDASNKFRNRDGPTI